MTKHKMKTAAAMGMLKLYSVGTTKIYKRENAYFIRAGSLDEAQRVWDRYKEQHFIDPLTPLPDGVTYKYNEYRECEYDYDYDNTLETVEEHKFNKESKWDREVLDELYPDQKQKEHKDD